MHCQRRFDLNWFHSIEGPETCSVFKWPCKLSVQVKSVTPRCGGVEEDAYESGHHWEKRKHVQHASKKLRSDTDRTVILTHRFLLISCLSRSQTLSLIWHSLAKDQMCSQAALLSPPIMSTYVLASDTSPPPPPSFCFYTAHVFTASTAPVLPLLLFEYVIFLIRPRANWNKFCSRVTAAHLRHFVIHWQKRADCRRKCILLMFTHTQHSSLR